MTEKSAIEKMVEWLENNENEVENGVDFDFIYEKARRLAAEEKAKPVEATAEGSLVDGNTSDGYHTFNELYDHRIALYLDIVSQNSEYFWKSKKHEDGSCFEGWFILGGNMGTGDISYHLPLSKWDLAHCKELPLGKKWDGHTAADVVERITRHSQAPNTYRPACPAVEELVRELKELVKIENGWCALQDGPVVKGLQLGMNKLSAIIAKYDNAKGSK